MDNKLIIGWQEWCALPDLKLPAIKAKIDSGAKSSALHALNIEVIRLKSVDHVVFDIFPLQGDNHICRRVKAPLLDFRYVMSSNGMKEKRYFIETTLSLGHASWPIELTLSNREPLQFRLLLGRQALGDRLLIDPHLECHLAKKTRMDVEILYRNKP